ncbi:MAG: GNAT family N-acetyltransferase [Nitrosopumilus sp.]
MRDNIRIELFADNYHFSVIIGKWLKDEWYEYYGPHGTGDARKETEECCHRNKLPIGLVAIDNDSIYGTVALKKRSASHINLTPWLTALYVTPEMRRKGVGRQLVKYFENLAIELGYRRIYARSGTAVEFFKRLGWCLIDETMFQGQELTIFSKRYCALTRIA